MLFCYAKKMVISLTFCVSGVCSYSQDLIGLPANKIKEVMEGSFLFKGAQIFYPDSQKIKTKDPTLDLTAESKALLEKQVNGLLILLSKEYKRKRNELETFFHHPMPTKLKTNLYLTNGKGGADVQGDGNSFRIDIDYALLESDFRASMINSLSAMTLARLRYKAKETGGNFTDTTATAEQVFSEFLEVKKEVNEYKPLTASDLLRGNMLVGMEYFNLADIGNAMLVLEKQYAGTLLFALAHEIGHIALGTVIKPDSADDKWTQASELDADRFSVLLLSNAFMVLGVQRIFVTSGQYGGFSGFGGYIYWMEKEYTEAFLGYGIFFDKGYELTYSRYPNFDKSPYPDAGTRLATAKDIFGSLYKSDRDKILEKFRRRQKWAVFNGYYFNRMNEAFNFLH